MKSLSVQSLSVRYGSNLVLKDVDLRIEAGAVVGLVGESGSGKSTLARAVAGLVPRERGQVLIGDRPFGGARPGVASPIQMIFQNPAASLNPRRTIGASIEEALEKRVPPRARGRSVAEALRQVGLAPEFADRLPSALSGGQKQRVAIARALAVEPSVLVADEITAALDLSVQAAILNLMADLRERLGLTILFISHNLAAVRYLCDTAAVMYAGRILEAGPTDALIRSPRDDYTKALIEAVPAFQTSPHSRSSRS